jgi:hypothetical protein
MGFFIFAKLRQQLRNLTGSIVVRFMRYSLEIKITNFQDIGTHYSNNQQEIYKFNKNIYEYIPILEALWYYYFYGNVEICRKRLLYRK